MECAMFDNRNDCTLYSFTESHPVMVSTIDPCAAAALNAYLDPALINWDMTYVDSLVKLDPTSHDSPQLPEHSLGSMLPPIDSRMMISPSCIPQSLLIPPFSTAANLTPPSADYLPIFWNRQPDVNHTMLPFSSSDGDCFSPPNLTQTSNTQYNITSSPQRAETPPASFNLRTTSVPPEEVQKPCQAPAQGKVKSTKHLRRHTISTSTVSAQRKPSASGARTRRSSQGLSSEEVQAKKMARLERNRLAACKSRQKRKMLTDDQLAALKILEDDTAKIEQQNMLLQAQLATINEVLKNHSC